MKTLPGTGCTLYYNDYEVFIEINAKAASTVDGILDTLQLPENVKTKEQNTNAVWFTLPILGQNWNPLKQGGKHFLLLLNHQPLQYCNRLLSLLKYR